MVTEDHTEVFTGFAEVGVRAEPVARCAAAEARDYVESGVPLGIYLADQMLVPMAIARGGDCAPGLSRATRPPISTRSAASSMFTSGSRKIPSDRGS